MTLEGYPCDNGVPRISQGGGGAKGVNRLSYPLVYHATM